MVGVCRRDICRSSGLLPKHLATVYIIQKQLCDGILTSIPAHADGYIPIRGGYIHTDNSGRGDREGRDGGIILKLDQQEAQLSLRDRASALSVEIW